MKCALCHRSIKLAYFTSAGQTFGPTCGARLGLSAAQSPVTPIQRPPKRRRARRLQWRDVVLQSGQGALFEVTV